ncbi:MAG: C25 family cysteine peptidase [candidate division WOR-3 bacterium]
MKRYAVLLVPVLLFAGMITKTLEFSPTELSITSVNGYDVVQLKNAGSVTEPGKPALPVVPVNVAVPANATVTGIEVIPLATEELAGSYRVHPAQEPVVLSAKSQPGFVPPDPQIYTRSEPFPGRFYDWNGYTGTMMGWRVCGFGVYPLQYEPASGRLTLYRRLQVRVSYQEGAVSPVRLSERQLVAFAPAVRSVVVNPEDVGGFAPEVRQTDQMDCDYAIITNATLAGSFQSLVDWRTKKGLYTRIFRTDSISARYPGRDLQEKIRNFIIDYWTNHGLIYVLLAGDNSLVPARRARCVVGTTTDDIPADLYYADLQWSWDGNRNNIFGEMSGDTVDLFYDLFLGRASVDNATQVSTFISKTLFYEKTPTTDYLQRMLLPYVMLWSSSGYSGRVVSETIAAKTPSGWTDAYIANPTTTTPMRDSINRGYHFCHAAAHGDDYGFYTESGTPIYTTSTASGQTNSTRPVILNSIACISGNFEAEDCLAEALMNNANGGAVATIMNSRYGWGTPPTMGPSEKLDCMFYDYYFIGDTVEIGRNHCSSKNVYGYIAQSQAVWRWCYYELNLFGDPALPLWNGAPGTMSAQNRDTITTGAQSFQVTVTSSGSPVVGALVCCYKPGEVHEVGYTNGSGVATVTINPLTTGTLYLTVSRKQYLPVEKMVVVVPGTPQPYITIIRTFVDDGGNNQLDPGETADLYVTVKNIGSAGATNVTGRLRTASGYITMSDSTASYGTLNANDTARGDRYRLTASASTPPGSQISFTLNIISNEGSWNPTFSLTVGTPQQPGQLWVNHDTGNCKLSVTALGSIGFTEPPSLDLGAGFSYPKTSASHLYYSSLLVGNSESYVVDRFYGRPASSINTDFQLVDSVRMIFPPQSGDEQFRAVLSDAAHSTPKNLRITQNSYMSAQPGYDDFVVLVYDIQNQGSSAVNGLYAGIFADFDVGADPTQNTVTSSEAKRFSYMRSASSANPCVGVKILEPQSFANLCAIDHARYVYPDSAMTEGMKFRILNGTVSQRNSNRSYDWSVGVSVGPFNLNPGASQRVAFAFVGGTSAADFEANADSAQSWYDNYLGIQAEEGGQRSPEFAGIRIVPNPLSSLVCLSYNLNQAGRVQVALYDITGRQVAGLLDRHLEPGRLELRWDASRLACGVYLVKITTPGGIDSQKLVIRR